ncbi:MAG TPA: cyclopropane fatty acyl phospholipid synthase [Balneolales bacterium]|nr:cyclopropane fatty acyl phospholipid synthase [Balneolales bacterium]
MDKKTTIKNLLDLADIKVNGDRPWDIKIHNPDLYDRVLAGGSLALGEAYMDEWWDSDALDEFFNRILRSNIDQQVKWNPSAIWNVITAKLVNMQSRSRAYKVGEHHYDLGNDLFKKMLDKRLVYSCGYWKEADNIDDAQEAKLDLICRKIGLEKGMRVLDIGCGWGSFAHFAAEKYGAEVVGVTVSREQVKLGNERSKDLPVEIRLQDYRDLDDKFDRIVSIGMFEHVGSKNYRTFMQVANRCLRDEGLLLLHTIGSNISMVTTDPWIHKYIFPNGMIPSTRQIALASEGLFVMEDWHNFGVYYDKTLMAWYENFTKNWNKLGDRYDHRFYRMWTYYLLMSAGAFRARKNQLWQVVFSKKGVSGGYDSIR